VPENFNPESYRIHWPTILMVLKVAGVTVPLTLLGRADEVIE